MTTVYSVDDGSAAEAEPDWGSLNITYTVENDGRTLYGGTMQMSAPGVDKFKAECVFDEAQKKLYVSTQTLQELDGYAASVAALTAQDPLYVYCLEDTSEYREYSRFTWDAGDAHTTVPGGNRWQATVHVTVGGVDCGACPLTIMQSEGEYYLYASRRTLEGIDAALRRQQANAAGNAAADNTEQKETAGGGHDEAGFAEIDAYLQGLSPVDVYCSEDTSIVRTYDSLRWAPPSRRDPIPGTDGWRFSSELTINGQDCGTWDVMVMSDAGTYYLYLPMASLDAIASLAGASQATATGAAAAATLPDFDAFLEKLDQAHQSESIVYYEDDPNPIPGIEVDWDALRAESGRQELADNEGAGWEVPVSLRMNDEADWQPVEKARVIADDQESPGRIVIPNDITFA